MIQTTDAERKTTSPVGLQETIDEIVRKYKSGRSFVRYITYTGVLNETVLINLLEMAKMSKMFSLFVWNIYSYKNVSFWPSHKFLPVLPGKKPGKPPFPYSILLSALQNAGFGFYLF